MALLLSDTGLRHAQAHHNSSTMCLDHCLPCSFLAPSLLPFGLPRLPRGATRGRNVTDLTALAARLVSLRAVRVRVLCALKSRKRMRGLMASLATFGTFARGSNVRRPRLCLSCGNHSRDRNVLSPESRSTSSDCQRTSTDRRVFSCDSGNMIRNVPILISSSKTLPLSRAQVSIFRSQTGSLSDVAPYVSTTRWTSAVLRILSLSSARTRLSTVSKLQNLRRRQHRALCSKQVPGRSSAASRKVALVPSDRRHPTSWRWQSASSSSQTLTPDAAAWARLLQHIP